ETPHPLTHHRHSYSSFHPILSYNDTLLFVLQLEGRKGQRRFPSDRHEGDSRIRSSGAEASSRMAGGGSILASKPHQVLARLPHSSPRSRRSARAGFLTPPRTAASSALSVSSSSGGGALLGEGVFRDGEMPTIDGPQGVHFSPGKSTIRSVNSGSTYTATVPAGARARTISAVTFGSVRQGTSAAGVAGASPVESAEEGDLGLLNDRNAGRTAGECVGVGLGSSWSVTRVSFRFGPLKMDLESVRYYSLMRQRWMFKSFG
ncbi:hypothetical protein DFP72DRAFT_1146771, partial [Ephemerocybe angulata]